MVVAAFIIIIIISLTLFNVWSLRANNIFPKANGESGWRGGESVGCEQRLFIYHHYCYVEIDSIKYRQFHSKWQSHRTQHNCESSCAAQQSLVRWQAIASKIEKVFSLCLFLQHFANYVKLLRNRLELAATMMRPTVYRNLRSRRWSTYSFRRFLSAVEKY